MQSTWEEAHSSALRELVGKGVPFSEIARALNERFGTAYTRNAAIGRARRLGLSVPQRADPAGPFPAARKPDARRIHQKRARNRHRRERRQRQRPVNPDQASDKANRDSTEGP